MTKIRSHVPPPSQPMGKGTFDCHIMISEVRPPLRSPAADLLARLLESQGETLTFAIAQAVRQGAEEGRSGSLLFPLRGRRRFDRC